MTFSKLVNRLMRYIEAVLIILLSLSVIVIVMQIFWRYVLRAPLSWTDQAARSGFIWTIMLGVPVMFNRNITMSFDLLLEKIEGPAHEIIRIIISILALAFCVFYFLAGIDLCVKTGGRTVPGMDFLPFNALYGAQPVSAFLLFLVFIKQTSETIQKMTGKEGK